MLLEAFCCRNFWDATGCSFIADNKIIFQNKAGSENLTNMAGQWEDFRMDALIPHAVVHE